MTIGNYPIGAAPIAGAPSDAEGLPSFPPTLVVTTWDPVASGPGMTLTNGNRQAQGTDTAISTRGQSVDYVGDIVAEVDFTIDVLASPFPTYFGLATSAANTSQIPGSDANGWAVKLEYVGKSADESIIELSYRHNGVTNFVGDYLINNPFDDPLLFFCVVKVGNGNLQLEVGTSEDDTYPPGPVADINVGTDNLQAGDVLYITSGYESDVVYLNGDNPAGFVNADDLYPTGINWDAVGAAGDIVLADVVLPLTMAPLAGQQFVIPLVTYIEAPVTLPLPFAPWLEQKIDLTLKMMAESFMLLPLGDGIPIDNTVVLPIDYGNPEVGQQVVLPLTMLIENDVVLPLGDSAPVADTLVLPLGFGDPVTETLIIPLADSTAIPVSNNIVFPLPIFGEAPTIITDQPTLTIAGKQVDIISAEINADDGSPYWQAVITLASPRDYGRFTRDAPFTLNLYGTVYSLIVDTRQLRRGMAADGTPGDTASITGLSPAAALGNPRAATITEVWPDAIGAQAAAEEAIGQNIDWRIIDWVIPGYRLAVYNASPLDVARQLAEVVGGLLLSAPDGTLIAQREFIDDAVTATLTEFDIFETNETIAAADLINKIRVTDIDTTYSDRLEFEPADDNPLRGTIRAYPSPWTEDVSFRDTAGVPVRVYPGAVELRTETETIEIQAGRGRTSYPIQAIQALDYIEDNLGGVSFEPGTYDVFTAADDWSLLEITYTTRSIAALVESDITTQAQILLERET